MHVSISSSRSQLTDHQGGRLPLAGGFQDGEKEWSKWEAVFEGLKKLEEQFKAEGKEG
jgi:2-keto-3-deoxy-L-rhamnonate aldolase